MLKRHKNKIIVISLIFVGLFLILCGSFNGKGPRKNEEFSYEEYTEALEEKIEAFLKSVKGIKKAQVLITLDTSNEKVYAQNSNNLDYIFSSSGEPIFLSEKYPQVRGVAIACTNGDDARVRQNITELISSYLGIPSNRIKIVAIR